MIVEVALFILLVVVYLVVTERKPPNMPPGPYEIPIIGGMPVMEETTAEPLRKKYGDLVCTKTGCMRTVIIFDYKTAKEVLARAECTGRPAFFRAFSIDELKVGGLVGSEGLEWQHDRRFVLRNLRNLGMGKCYLEGAINIEAQALVDDLKKYNGEVIEYPDSFRTAALNIIWQMIASRRYDARSEEVQAYYDAAKEFQSVNMAIVLLPMFFPTLMHLPKFVRDLLFREDASDEFTAKIKKIVETTVNEHEKTFDIDNPRDLIDEYLKDMKEAEGDENSLLRKGALLQILVDLFDGGSDTVNGTLKWMSYMLAKYPEIMRKLQQEIDEAVPRDRLVSLDDKPNLPNVEAFIMEVLRFSSLAPMNLQHRVTSDMTLQGYSIPKGTFIATANYSIHNDPDYWAEPEKFSPGRFIDEDGKFCAPKEAFFAFSSGRRQCPGETLAKMQLFMFTAAIVQNFDVLVPQGKQLIDGAIFKIAIRIPKHTKLIYKYRG